MQKATNLDFSCLMRPSNLNNPYSSGSMMNTQILKCDCIFAYPFPVVLSHCNTVYDSLHVKCTHTVFTAVM
jgi:hypothetical protein